MTIGVLPAYRRRGIASFLLDYLLEDVSKNNTNLEVYLHVQTTNEDAKNFYIQKGFIMMGTIKDYYRKITPPDCFILGKSLVEGHQLEVQAVTESESQE